MWQEMILRYSKEGDTILDPLAGIGTTLIGALMGRNCILIELEQHFVDPMRRSWEKMRCMPMMGYTMGGVTIIRGDARCLPLLSADCVITSPPYERSLVLAENGIDESKLAQPYGPNSQFARPQTYTRPVDAIVTSPPWEDKTALQDSQWLHAHEAELAESFRQAHVGERGLPGNTKAENRTTMEHYVFTPRQDIDNVGNLRGDVYWAAMKKIYAECWRVLKPGGIMAVVLKGFTRTERRKTAPKDDVVGEWRHKIETIIYCQCGHIEEEHVPNCLHDGCGCKELVSVREEKEESWVKGGYVDLPGQTEAMLLEMGWQKHDEWRRQLWSLSFWRILQKRRDPEAWDERLGYESVLAFRKPEGTGKGVDAVITSPPYEQSLHEGQAGPGATSDDGAWYEGREVTRAAYTRPAEEFFERLDLLEYFSSRKKPKGSTPKKRYQRCFEKELYIVSFVILKLKPYILDVKETFISRPRADWKQLRDEWNKAHPFDRMSPEVLKVRYFRAIAKPDIQDAYIKSRFKEIPLDSEQTPY